VVTDLATKAGLAGKFEIAGQITPSSCLSYHAALEYHGLAHQVFYELYVSSHETFKNFDYDGITFIFCPLKSEAGIVCPVTDSFVIGKSTRYLTDTHESDTYFKDWKLIAPQNILSFLEQGGAEHV